ncbi:hypothetical protein HOU39_gp110 [Lactobacillus phage Iacchus]|uniref:Uncharacterized protein n=1 Tax=Lactobacillus phage Iacchus TaxID=2315483 RepID=A0A3Q8I811_9CAUD|nr:hypothetical protein HOU39_gp110 [Lactobacillus phage Iacchus]AYH92004.1 hypothetical protein [Lactobacillus phage Iacchus]AYH92176.1 hypothetical protein [Lactobacillus phage Dionysus]
MKLGTAIELLQDDTFDMQEAFYSDLAGDVYAEYTLRVTDAETLLTELELDLSGIDDYDALHDAVEDELANSFDGGVDGVETV